MKLVVFDCDGTIVDSQAGIVLSMVHAFTSLQMTPPTREATLSVVGLSLPEAFAVLAPDVEKATRAELAERYKSAFRELKHDPAETEILFPQAKEIIAQLAARDDHLLGIATGKSRRGIDRLFDREGWHGSFATIQTADDHPSKPHPSMLHRAMLETDTAPEVAVMIGDTTYDMAMARSAGIAAIGVAWGYHTVADLMGAGAHIIVERFTDLPQAIEDVFAIESRAA
ncbi:HAD-IA family hydrolase [Hyphomicrobium sp.]|uniref:HAD-IA family hydrolase n=1 Tax=Hyphomicrobium sp. TaxID=82 RepID=UPI000F9D6DE2|nr:HAD-IA family hydrolase [Hyphomicrobium sp.]RUO98095.1 MAG: HAD family hydrolase [Hyphomicrobium sp.]